MDIYLYYLKCQKIKEFELSNYLLEMGERS